LSAARFQLAGRQVFCSYLTKGFAAKQADYRHLIKDCQTDLVEVGEGINKLKSGFDKLNLTLHFLN